MSKDTNTVEKRDGFQSKWGFILACIGSAVGMGNIWRFPIMVQQYGGMTFLLPYFLFVILIGSSGVIEEFALGRRAKAGPVGAFGMCTKERTGSDKAGKAIGAIPIIGALMLAIGYTVVLGWIFKYTFLSISGGLYSLGTDMGAIGGTFGVTAPEAETLGEALKAMASAGFFGIGNGVWQIIALVVSLAIMVMGIAGGIEKANKIMMPVLFGLFLVLAVYIATLPGAQEGYKYILTINPAGLADPKAALLAALVIVPSMAAVLGAGISEVHGGPGLMFVYLVNVFNAMPGGRIIGVVFFICVLFAGVSSIVNLYEAPIAFLQEQFKFKRAAAVGTIGVIGLIVSISIQPWTSQWMDVVSIYICPLGAALAGVMFFWVLSKKSALEEVNNGAKKPIGSWFYPLGKYVYIPLSLAALVLGIIYGGIG